MTRNTPPQDSFTRWGMRTLIYVLSAFGAWTMLVWIGLWLGWSFNTLMSALWILPPVLLALVPFSYISARSLLAGDQAYAESLSAHAPRTKRIDATSPSVLVPPALAALMLLASIGLILTKASGSTLLEWGLFAGSCLFLFIAGQRSSGGIAPPCRAIDQKRPLSGLSWLAYGLACALLMLAYLTSTNTDADDTHFVGAAVSLMEHPNATLFELDSMFGTEGLKNYIFMLNHGQSWEALIAVTNALTGIDHLDLYYCILPLLGLMLVPIVLFLFAHRYFAQAAWVGVFFAITYLLAWSTDNHVAGHFFVPRFFQGKALLVSLILPAILLVSRGLAERPSPTLSVTLAILLICGAGASSTGLYIGILTAGIGYLAFVPLRVRPAGVAAFWFALAAIPTLLMLGDAYIRFSELRDATSAAWEGVTRIAGGPRRDLSMAGAFGGAINLVMILILTWIGVAIAALKHPINPRLKQVSRLLLVLVLIGLNNPLAQLVADTIGPPNVLWRWHWALPIGLMLTLIASSAYQSATASMSESHPSNESGPKLRLLAGLGPATIVGLLLLALLAANASFLARKHGTGIHVHKITPEQTVALDYFRQEDLTGTIVLADTRIGQLLPRFPNNAQLILPGTLYTQVAYFSGDELNRRHRLLGLIDLNQSWSAEDKTFFVNQVRDRGVNLIVFNSQSEHRQDVDSTLRELSWSCEPLGIWRVCRSR